MAAFHPLLAGLVALIFYVLYRLVTIVFSPTKLWKVPGPPSSHWILGHMRETMKAEQSVLHEQWAAEYGHVLIYRGMFGSPRMMTTDLRAIAHILHRTDVYQKPEMMQKIIERILGRGVLVAEGEAHRIQRKALNPAFGPGQLRDLTGVMLDKSNELKERWFGLLATASGDTKEVQLDAPAWLAQTTLDIMGLAGFGYAFESLSGRSNELHDAFKTILGGGPGGGGTPILFALSALLPGLRYLPTKRNRAIKHGSQVLNRVGGQLIAERKQAAALEAAQGEKIADTRARDLLSLLVRANTAADARERLSDQDVIAQIPTFLLAGHETTATLLSWILLELTSNLPLQEELRAECRSQPLGAAASGNAPLAADELTALDKLPLLDAIVRETLRIHSPVGSTIRAAFKDDSVPLSRPYTDRSGVVHDTIEMTKGDQLFVPMVLINRLEELWGPDAGQWRPQRWLAGSNAPDGVPEAVRGVPGIWGNVMTFLGGPHSCIGFKFALYEAKIVLHTLISNFHFELAVPRSEVTSRGGMLTRPYIKANEKEGGHLPLRVRKVED